MKPTNVVAVCVGGVFVGVVLCGGVVGLTAPGEALYYLATGWILYPAEVIPQVRPDMAGVTTAVVCLVGLAAGLHHFLRWLNGQVRPASAWSLRKTLALLFLVVLMFVAGTAALGVGHQAAWLATSPEPLVEGTVRGSRLQSQSNLKQLAMATLYTAERHPEKVVPPYAVLDPDGRPLLSVRVLLLPYLEEQDLFAKFRLDEPWDSPHNLRLLPRMPKIYQAFGAPPTTPSYATHYRCFVGPGTAFEPGRKLRYPDDFTDGTSKTILFVEAAEAVPWTKPEGLPFVPRRPLPRLGLPGSETFNVAFADGSTRFIKVSIPDDVLRPAITPAGKDDANRLNDW